MPPHLEKSRKSSTFGEWQLQTDSVDLRRELELKGLEASDELKKITLTQNATDPNPEKPKPTCYHCKKPGHYRAQLNREKDPVENIKNSAGNNITNNINHNNKKTKTTTKTITIIITK